MCPQYYLSSQAFNVTLHVGKLLFSSEAATVMSKCGLSAREVSDVVAHALTKYEPSGSSSSDPKLNEIVPIGIKQLLMVVEMARSIDEEEVTAEKFLECLRTCGV